MPKLFRPDETVRQTGDQLNVEAAQATGRAQAKVGQQLQQLNEQYFEVAKRAEQTIQYTQAISKATAEYTQASNQRYQQQADEEGNPTYNTLVDDITKSGDQIKSKALANIKDPEVADRFSAEFDKFALGQKTNASNKARKQQIDFAQAGLVQSLEQLQIDAIQHNPDQLAFYENQVEKLLETHVASGIISPQDGNRFRETFRSSVRTESYRNLIDSDPQGIKETLSTSDLNTLGLKEKERDQLVREADRAIADQEREAKIIEAEKKQAEAHNQKLAQLDVEYGILTGNIGLKELEEKKDEIGALAYKKYRNAFARKQDNDKKVRDVTKEISEVILGAGTRSITSYTPKQINSHFEAAVATMTDPQTGRQPSLHQQAEIAAGYKVDVSAMNKKLSHNIINGSLDNAQDSVQAYSFLKKVSPVALKSLNKEAEAVVSLASTFVENTNMEPREAMSMARDAILKKDPEVRKQQAAGFRKLDISKADGIENFLQDIYDPGFFDNIDSISPGTAERLKPLLQEAYILTGDEEAAKAMVERQIKADFGVTEFNGGDQVMFAAPELLFPAVSHEELQGQLINDLKSQGILDITADNIIINSDALTRGTFDRNGVEAINYSVVKKHEDGSIEILYNDKGEPLRWFPDEGSIVKSRNEALIEEAKKEQEARIKAQDKRSPAELFQSILPK